MSVEIGIQTCSNCS